MTEYINKVKLWNKRPEWLNQIMQREIDSAHNRGWNECNDEWLNIIKSMPTTEIVHCKDCKHRGLHKLYQEVLIDNWCEIHGKIAADLNWFCADGEKLPGLKHADKETLQSAT